MNQMKQILAKFNLLVNPLKLFTLYRQFDKLIKEQQNSYPKDKQSNDLFLKVDQVSYRLKRKKCYQVDNLPNKANLVSVSKQSIDHALVICGGKNDGDINTLLQEIRKIKDIEVYQQIFDVLSENFSTNLSMKQLFSMLVSK
ncbi:hypothetical protein [Pseudolactococcus carnosus]|uniref:hypothetical protein n=1 Tax=Pseudolactococcus carnosus TaxID=2749961 RepID=UPI001FBAD66F|nr:hypothetical protein [Lactococcus carnosus]MCJ1972898.1 hypothetical protein [Lactococcus carnosus]